LLCFEGIPSEYWGRMLVSSSCSCSSAQILSNFSIGEVKLGVASVTDFFRWGIIGVAEIWRVFFGGFRGS